MTTISVQDFVPCRKFKLLPGPSFGLPRFLVRLAVWLSRPHKLVIPPNYFHFLWVITNFVIMRTWKSRLRLFTHVKPSAFLLFPHFAINMLVKTCTMDRFLIKRSLALEHPYRVLFRPYYGRGKCFDLLRSVVNNWFLGLGGTKRQCRPKKNVFMTHPVLKENWTSFPLVKPSLVFSFLSTARN